MKLFKFSTGWAAGVAAPKKEVSGTAFFPLFFRKKRKPR